MYGRASLVLSLFCVLLIAGCAQRQQPAPVEKVYQGRSIYDYEANSLAGSTYQVQKGDTLYSIAFRANIDVRALARLNDLGEPYTIYPGQRLTLRAAARPTQKTQPTTTSKRIDSPQSVDKTQKKEYVEDKSKEKVTNSPAQPRPTIKREVFPSSNDIAWRWPTGNSVIREFTAAVTGPKGIDFAGKKGDIVRAAAAGKVVYAGNALKGYGNLIILKHNDDYITAYAHNDKLLIKEQQWVSAGDAIAEMGNSDAERVKLHFEVRYRGKSVNPRHYLPRGSQ
ncbi:peptidase M23 [Pseudidiomarina aquimaris]|uniref:Peptidase M23 n=1 Tax=Pseudidiomarina aquimaris TaxID=641841 RepID=A0A432XQB0_9GAMM|nr:peptidoglycan DD-metalloendopeptidase family protein [Pseudidiomarina aquimaris]RUO50919.1 peptidase M23 [Pseudidiomarina aquimaris]|tara:strand:+ start:1409 stop:2251 length:843 start_codon:yes stop_codon:yes gene_type:complete